MCAAYIFASALDVYNVCELPYMSTLAFAAKGSCDVGGCAARTHGRLAECLSNHWSYRASHVKASKIGVEIFSARLAPAPSVNSGDWDPGATPWARGCCVKVAEKAGVTTATARTATDWGGVRMYVERGQGERDYAKFDRAMERRGAIVPCRPRDTRPELFIRARRGIALGADSRREQQRRTRQEANLATQRMGHAVLCRRSAETTGCYIHYCLAELSRRMIESVRAAGGWVLFLCG
jgi:hypothetical protein